MDGLQDPRGRRPIRLLQAMRCWIEHGVSCPSAALLDAWEGVGSSLRAVGEDLTLYICTIVEQGPRHHAL